MPDKKLPEFMSQARIEEYDEDTAAGKFIKTNRLMLWVTAGWFLIVLLYITQFFGWSNLVLMMPNEFGIFLAGITVPLAVIWLVVSYIERGNHFNSEARLLRAYMNQLVFPEEGSSEAAKALTDAVRAQVTELQEVTKLATKQTEKIKHELGGRVDDFAKLVSILDNYSSNTIVALTENVKSLVENFEIITNQAENSTDTFKNQITDFSSATENMQFHINSIVDSLAPRIQDMKNFAYQIQTISDENNNRMNDVQSSFESFTDKAHESLNKASDVLSYQSDRLQEVSGHTVQNYNDISRHLENGIKKIDDTLKSQNQFILEHIHNLDKQSEVIAKKFATHREDINVEVDKLLARTNAMNEGIAMQVRELGGVEEEVIDKMKSIENSISQQSRSLSDKADIAVDDINQVINLLDEKAREVIAVSEDTVVKTNQAANEISAKHDKLIAISDSITENLAALNKEFEEKNKNIKTLAAESIDRFTDIGNVMKKNSDSLTEASSIVVSQSKISEASLAQQQRHITGSMNKIEEIKNEIKRQIDEFTKVAATIDENATSAVGRLKAQMTDVLKSSETVVDKTKILHDKLHSQAVDFDSVTNNTLSKVSKFEDILTGHYKKLEDVSTLVKDRSYEVNQTLKSQTDLITKTTDNSTNTFNEILNAFETQSTLLNSVAQNTVGYVSDVVQALDEKAEAINLLFKHQENEFFDICDRISENTDNIGTSLKKQVATIEQSADRVFARMGLLEEDVNKRAEAVLANSAKSIDKLSEIGGLTAKQNQEVENFMAGITEKLHIISDSFKNNVAGFNNTVKEVREETNQATSDIIDNCDKIGIAKKELAAETKNVTGLLDTHLKNIDVALIKTKSQSEAIKETLDVQKENLADVANIVSTQSRLGEASLAQQYKYLSDAALEVSNKMTEINKKFKGNTDTIFETSNKLSYEFDVLGDKLIKISEDIFKTSKSSIKNVESVNMSLGQCSEELNSLVGNSTQKVKSVIKDYESYIANFNSITAEASTGVVEINDMISQQSDKMIGISEGTKEVVEYFNTVLNATSKDLSDRANDAYDKVKGLGASLKSLSIQLEETSRNTTTHFTNSGDKFRATISEISSNAERISNDIRTSGEVFLKQSGVLVAATEDTLEKVNGVMGMLADNSDDFVKKGGDLIQKSYNFSDLFNKQFNLLEDISAKADTKLQDLIEGYEGVRVDSFLKDAAYIIERLEAFSVDLNRIYNPQAEEDLWKKYYAGDTSVFVRHLAKTLDKKQIASIKKEFEKNVDFRNLVTRYLTDFETLVGKAKSNEKSGILLSVLSGADIGKLYYILAKSLDKLH